MAFDKISSKNNILVADDDKVIRDFLEKWLRNKGYQSIELVASGQEALEAVKKKNIDLVLLDIKMPGMDGVEVLHKIKEINKDIGVIMITGFIDEEKAKQAMKEGAYDYIMKPFDLAYLELSVFTKINTIL